MKKLLTLLMVMTSVMLFGQSYNKMLTVTNSSKGDISLNFSCPEYVMNAVDVENETMHMVSMPGSFLPNNAGFPNLPAYSRYIAVPNGAEVKLNIATTSFETMADQLIAPAPAIPADIDDTPLTYVKNEEIYTTDAFYPASPVVISEITEIRGAKAILVSFSPFQYNPVTKELRVFSDLDATIEFIGGDGTFGDTRLRSRFFDPLLSDMLVNYEQLPEINYEERYQEAFTSKDDEGCEYLIVVPNNPEYSQWADSLWAFRQQQGILTKIVTLDEIGGTSYNDLKSYFQDAYINWDIPPAAVLLMADYGTNANNTIISGTVTHPYSGSCVTDNKFADVNNNNLPDMTFARMTATNATHLETMVTKCIHYEKNPPIDAPYYDKMVTALGWQTERWFQLCSEVIGGYYREVKDKNPIRINAVYSGSTSVWSTATNTSTVLNYFSVNGLNYIPATPGELGGWTGGTAAQVNNAINEGVFIVTHRDHGYESGWGEPAYSNYWIGLLTNTENRLPFVFSMNCSTGKFNMSGECFAEKFHRHTKNGENAGALGIIAATEVSYSFVNDVMTWGMWNGMDTDFMPDETPHIESRSFMPSFGLVSGKYFLQQSSWPYNPGDKTITYHLFHFHGDPYQVVYTEVPQDLTVVHPTVIVPGSTSIEVSAEEGAVIAITAENQILAVATATGDMMTMDLVSYTGDEEYLITVTKQDYFRYMQYIPQNLDPVVTVEDYQSCIDATVDVTATASNYTTIEWTTAGTGEFSDATVLDPVYTPSQEDYDAESIELYVTVGDGTLSAKDTSDVVFIDIPAQLASPSGESQLCLNPEHQLYVTENIAIIDSYEWELIPSNAGGFNSDSSSVQINWLNDFVGDVALIVRGTNSCGTGEWSDTLKILIYETPAVPTAIEQEVELVCNTIPTLFTATGSEYLVESEWLIEPTTFSIETEGENAIITFENAGNYTLQAKAINQCGESDWSDPFTVTVHETLTEAIIGNNNPCLSSEQVYTIPVIDGLAADEYIWTLTPPEAGTVVAEGNSCTITWRSEEEGDVVLSLDILTTCVNVPTFDVQLKDCTGVNEFHDNGVTIYPNPSKGDVHIKLASTLNEDITYNVYNTLGKLVQHATIEAGSSEVEINLSEAGKGIYFIQLSSETLHVVERIIIN